MKVWVLKHRSALREGMWTGDGLKFTTNLDDAVQFVRRVDAERVLDYFSLLDAEPTEMELGDRDEPGAR